MFHARTHGLRKVWDWFCLVKVNTRGLHRSEPHSCGQLYCESGFRSMRDSMSPHKLHLRRHRYGAATVPKKSAGRARATGRVPDPSERHKMVLCRPRASQSAIDSQRKESSQSIYHGCRNLPRCLLENSSTAKDAPLMAVHVLPGMRRTSDVPGGD